MDDPDTVLRSERWVSISGQSRPVVEEIKEALEKNMKLLSFSMDHVKSSVENIVGFINKATYGGKQERISYFPAREI